MDNPKTFKLIVFTSALFFSSLAYSQVESYDTRLEAIFTESQINNWQEKQPQILSYWEFYLDNSYVIIDQLEGKLNPAWPQIELALDTELNILAFPHVLNAEKRQYYTITNSKKILLIHSQAEILSAFNLNSHQR